MWAYLIYFYVLDHKLEIASEPLVVPGLLGVAVGGGPLGVTLFLYAVCGEHQITAKCYEVMFGCAEGLCYTLLSNWKLISLLL